MRRRNYFIAFGECCQNRSSTCFTNSSWLNRTGKANALFGRICRPSKASNDKLTAKRKTMCGRAGGTSYRLHEYHSQTVCAKNQNSAIMTFTRAICCQGAQFEPTFLRFSWEQHRHGALRMYVFEEFLSSIGSYVAILVTLFISYVCQLPSFWVPTMLMVCACGTFRVNTYFCYMLFVE